MERKSQKRSAKTYVKPITTYIYTKAN